MRQGRIVLTVALVAIALTVCAVQYMRQENVFVASAVLANSPLRVYWDQACSRPVSQIDWGNLTLGQTKKVTLYIRNEGNVTLFLALRTLNWEPQNASTYLGLTGAFETRKLPAYAVTKVTPSLQVSLRTKGITGFRFDIIIEGTSELLADINNDGIVGIIDVAVVSSAYGSTPTRPTWDPNADLNKDGVVSIDDLAVVTSYYGTTSF